MPVLVSAFLNEARGFLRACLRVAPVPKLPAVRAQSGSKGALVCGEIFRRIAVADAKLLDGLAGARLADAARLLDRLLKILAEIAGYRGHSGSP
jgi:hypothetical protein